MRRPGNKVVQPPLTAGDPLSLLRAYDVASNPARPVRPSPLSVSTVQGLPLELLDRLRSFPLFASAPETFIGAIGRYLRPQIHQPHDVILAEGDDSRAMYWLVRGAVRVTSRDGESTYAELKPGAFFGEIGILMDIPRTATITASIRSLVVRLNKEDLQQELPSFPEIERAIREEATERLAILERKKKEGAGGMSSLGAAGMRKRSRDYMTADVEMAEVGDLKHGDFAAAAKNRKSPSPGLAQAVASSVFGVGTLGKTSLTIRQILRELPLFRDLPEDLLHYLGMNAQPCTFPPFTDIIRQGSQGREVYFLVAGEVEVVTSTPGPDVTMHGSDLPESARSLQRVRARFKPGQYFGEVVSLSLAPTRTATVRSINQVEVLRITGEVLDELWKKSSPGLRGQVESEARKRLECTDRISTFDGSDEQYSVETSATHQRRITPAVTFSEIGFESVKAAEPMDPDPFFNADLDVPKAKSRRSSLAPPGPDHTGIAGHDQSPRQASPVGAPSPLQPKSPAYLSSPISPRGPSSSFSAVDMARKASQHGKGRLPDTVLVRVLRYLDFYNLIQMRRVSMYWHRLLATHQDLLHTLDLSHLNRRVTDAALVNVIAPFVGSRPRYVNLNNCFHVTDEGFSALASMSASNVRIWRMRSVWEVSGQCILDLVGKAPFLEEIDLSNCRKVGDNLLARIIGNIAPQSDTRTDSGRLASPLGLGIVTDQQTKTVHQVSAVRAASIRRITLSYCKHVQDRSMAHIAQHAASRLEVIDLTRCTSVTDQGFRHWSMYNFPKLRKLVLADCTYLSDQSIVGIANAARNLRELDLSFCCALSDTATEVLSLGLTQLTHLDLAFCGSAVSDSSLRCIGLHLLELKFLSVRGCVRVTGQGVEGVLHGCRSLEVFDVSQCKNLTPWLASGGIQAARNGGCKTRFELIADGTWRNIT